MVSIKESDVRDLRYREVSFGNIASVNFQFSDLRDFMEYTNVNCNIKWASIEGSELAMVSERRYRKASKLVGNGVRR